MKIGNTVKIKECPVAELVGENAEIIEKFEECDYPLKVEIASGKHQGTVYHFKYDEVEILPKVYQAKALQ